MPNTKPRSKKQKPPDRSAIEKAVRDLLRATGLRESEDLVRTPERVARMWIESWIDGEGKTPEQLIPKPLKTKSRDLIVMKGIEVHSVCPHHLLPYPIVAHIAFVPNGYTAGFSRIADLIEAYAHRLVLLEDLAQHIIDGLTVTLNPEGAAVVLQSRQSCMLYQGRARKENQVTAVALRGLLETNDKRRAEVLHLMQA